MDAFIGFVGVVLGSIITSLAARGDRKFRVKEARRAEKMAAFGRLLNYVDDVQGHEAMSDEELKEVGTRGSRVLNGALLVCDEDGQLFKSLTEEYTAEALLAGGTELGTSLLLAIREELEIS